MQFRIYYHFLLAISIFFLKSGFAQNPEPVFRHFTTEDGLPSSQVYDVIQDTNGYVWFATDRGVVKYNGYEFKTFTSKDGLADNTVFHIFQDENKRIWMLSYSGNVFIYEYNKITPYKYNSLLINFVKGSIPLGIYVDKEENVFVSCQTSGVLKIDKSGKETHRFLVDKNKNFIPFFLMVEPGKNNLIFNYVSGKINKPSVSLIYMNNTEVDSLNIKVENESQCFAIKLKNNSLLFSIGKALFKIHNHSVTCLVNFSEKIICLYEDNKQQLWVGTTSGLYLYNKPGNYIENNHYLSSKYIGRITQDKEGGYWICTINDGVYYLINNDIKNFYSDDKLKSVMCLASDGKSKIVAGYWNGSILNVNSKALHTIYKSNNEDVIYCLFVDTATGRIYFGNKLSGYLDGSNFHNLKVENKAGVAIGFIKNKRGIFSGRFGAVYKIVNDSCHKLTDFAIRINCITQNEKGEIILGCRNGAYKFDDIDSSLSLINKNLLGVRVDDIALFNGNICFATRGQGLLMFKDNKIREIDQRKGLYSNLIHKIKVSSNKIWCASYNGISEITFTDRLNFKYNIVNIRSSDGLSGNEVNDLCILNDTVWVASKKGISFFKESTDFVTHATPTVQFTSFRINNTDTNLSDNYKFSHDLNTIRIGYEAVSFRSDGKLKYHYLLTNMNDSISDLTTNREVEFLSLKPGDYTFQVKAINNFEALNAKPSILKFSILLPFWQTWWFILSVFLFIGFCILYYVRYRITAIKKQERIKTEFNKQLVLLELKSLRAQMNPHFIFNVMNSIQDYILKNDAISAQKYLAKFAKLVRLILNSSIEGEILLEDELNAVRIYVELEQQRFDKTFDFHIEVDKEVNSGSILLPSMMIQPYLENSIKHGISHIDVQGKLILKIINRGNSILISIEDNGSGRQASTEWNKSNVRDHVSHGATITSRRIEAYNIAHNTNIQTSIVDVKNENDLVSGTRVEIIVPVKFKG